MRLAALLSLLVALLVVACNPATPAPPTATPAPETTVDPEIGAAGVLSMTIQVPPPGTLVVGNSNVPPGGRPPIDLDTVTFLRTGGIAGQQLTVELRRDGTLIRDGETTNVSAEVLADANNRLNLIDFYGIQGIFTGPLPPDAFLYNLTVDSTIGSRTISAQDGLTPPELIELFNFFSQLGA